MWTDVPGTIGSDNILVNDLTLAVAVGSGTGASGRVHFGNNRLNARGAGLF